MKAKKHLGQHFLHEQGVLDVIRDTVGPTKNDLIVEIGPGTGNLTAEIVPGAGKVIAVEKDPDMVRELGRRFPAEIAAGKLDILERDALTFNPEELRKEKYTYKLAGNIPYNITGALLEHYLSASYQPEKAVFLVQREVAERIITPDQKESILSLSIKAFGKPSIVQRVGRGAFTPAPKVESAILLIDNISRHNFKNHDHEELFFEIVKTGFAHKRKTVSSNLSRYFVKENVLGWLEKANIPADARSEDIHLPEWLKLTDVIYTSGSEF